MRAYRKSIGLLCFIVAGLVWPAGFAMGYTVPQVLPVHLLFICGGIGFRGSHLFEVLQKRKRAKL